MEMSRARFRALDTLSGLKIWPPQISLTQLQVEPDESIPCTAGSLTHPDAGSPSTRSLHSDLRKRGIGRTDAQCIHSPSSQGSYQLLPHLLQQAVPSKITQYRKYTGCALCRGQLVNNYFEISVYLGGKKRTDSINVLKMIKLWSAAF